MRKTLKDLAEKRKTLLDGSIALGIVLMIALGCTCNKDFNLGGNTATENQSNQTVADKDTFPVNKTNDTSRPPATRADASKGEMPADDELQYMARTTLLDFNDAIQKADFSDFHGNISKTWQKQLSAERFKQEFQAFIDKRVDISAIGSETADFSPAPTVERTSGTRMLVMQGSYDISPSPTTFELKYIPEGKEWKLFGIDVRTKSFK